MFGILGLLFRGAREKLQERAAKSSLESKLGRKVSKEELYSLSSHLDAAEATNAPAQSPYPPQNAVATSDNTRPLLTKTRVVAILGILFVVFAVVGTVAFVALLPESTFNRYSPFTPNPPDGSFPAQVGAFKREKTPDYTNEDYTVKIGPRFEIKYAAAAASVNHSVWAFKSEAEARSAFDAKKNYYKVNNYQVPVESDSRFVSAWRGSDIRVIWLEGTQVREIKGYSQKNVYEFEAALNNTTPAEVVNLGTETPTPAANDGTLTVVQLLDEYKKDTAAADKKYKDKIIKITGKTALSEKDKKGNWMIAFMRPESKTPADGMVICTFDKSKEASVSTVKKGDTVTLEGKVSTFIIFSAMLENCSKL